MVGCTVSSFGCTQQKPCSASRGHSKELQGRSEHTAHVLGGAKGNTALAGAGANDFSVFQALGGRATPFPEGQPWHPPNQHNLLLGLL